MPTPAELLAADNAAVVEAEEKFGKEEAAKLYRELYLRRRNPPDRSPFASFPRGLVMLIALWVAALETADKLPQLLLSVPRYEAALAEAKGKLVAADMAQAQLEKAKNDAITSGFQPQIAGAQLKREINEAAASNYQPKSAEAQMTRAVNEARASQYQPETAQAQLKAALWQPFLTAAQGWAAQGEFIEKGSGTTGPFLHDGNLALYLLRP